MPDTEMEPDNKDGSSQANNPHLDWNQVKTVLLDMDGTLLDLHFDNHFWLDFVPERYAEKHGMQLQEANEKLMARYTEKRGTLDWYCVDFWTRELGLEIENLKHEIADRIAIRPDVENFLHWLNHHEKHVVLVTNAHPASLNLKMDKTRLHVHFDRIINSHELGLAKEHDGFWGKLEDVEPYQPASTMLIDDNLEVLACARDHGIAHCYGIVQPDSQKGLMQSEEFVLIDRFSRLMGEF